MNETIQQLIEQLFELEELHQEYQDNDNHFVIDVQKPNDSTINIKVELKENKDKKEFEEWVKSLDDDLFQETWENLSEVYGLKELNDKYESDSYQDVINLFKQTSKEIAKNKIDYLKEVFDID